MKSPAGGRPGRLGRGTRGRRAPEHAAVERRGFTVLELLVALTIVSIVLGVGLSGIRNYREATIVDRAAEAVAADVRLARSFAIQRRSTVAMVVDEATRSYALRDESTADTLLQRRFDAASELPLTRLDVADGTSLTFDARGVLSAAGTVQIAVGADQRQRTVTVSKLGRTRTDPAP